MKRHEKLKLIRDTGILLVLNLEPGEELAGVMQAMQQGGVAAVEVPLPEPAMQEVFSHIAKMFWDSVLLGVSNVAGPEAAQSAARTGARFITTLARETETITYCKHSAIPVFAVCRGMDELRIAHEAGADMVRLFSPAMNTPDVIEKIRNSFHGIEVISTGGITLENLEAYIQAGASALGLGGQLVDQEAIESGLHEETVRKAERFIRVVQEARKGFEV